MNILVLTTELPYPDNSGGRKYTAQRIEMLKEKGNNIYLFSFSDEDSIQSELYNKFNYIKLYKKGLNKKYIYKLMLTPYTVINKYNSEIKKDIENLRTKNKIDLIICECPQLLFNLNNISDIPIVLTQHNVEYLLYRSIALKSKNIIKKVIYLHESLKLFRYEKRQINKCNIKNITFISNRDMGKYRKNFGYNKGVCIPFSVKNIANTEEKQNKDIDIIFVGKMDYHPNIEAVKWFYENIFSEIVKSLPEVSFYIVGKDPVKEILDLNKIKNICITGMVDSVDEYVNRSKLFIIPLLSGGGIKIKLYDAIKHKIPVVTTSVGIEGTDFKNNVHIYEENDSKNFADKCIEILSKNFDENITERAYKMLNDRYNFEDISKVYNDVIASNNFQ